MDVKAAFFSVLLLVASIPASASRPITEKDGMVCLSGQGLPADTRQGDITLQVDDKDLVPLDATSHLAVFVDIEARHQARLRSRDGQVQVLEVDFKETSDGSACLRYDPDRRKWAITPSDKRNVCLDCAPDWVQQEPAYTSPSTGKE